MELVSETFLLQISARVAQNAIFPAPETVFCCSSCSYKSSAPLPLLIPLSYLLSVRGNDFKSYDKCYTTTVNSYYYRRAGHVPGGGSGGNKWGPLTAQVVGHTRHTYRGKKGQGRTKCMASVCSMGTRWFKQSHLTILQARRCTSTGKHMIGQYSWSRC